MLGFFVFALVLAASAQTPPTLSDDFTAEVKLDMVNHHNERHMEGKWFFDKTGLRDRFDAEIVGIGRVDLWKIWNTTKVVNEYLYDYGKQTCHKRSYDEPLYGVFDFLPHSTLKGECEGGNHKWSVRIQDAFELDACITTDGHTPLWVERKFLVEKKHHVVVRFHKYVPGRPDASQFTLPSACSK